MRPLAALATIIAAVATSSVSAADGAANVLSLLDGQHTLDGVSKNSILLARFKFDVHPGYYRRTATRTPTILSGTVTRCKVIPLSLSAEAHMNGTGSEAELCGDARPVVIRVDADGNGDASLIVTKKWVRLDTHETITTTAEEPIGKVSADGGRLYLMSDTLVAIER